MKNLGQREKHRERQLPVLLPFSRLKFVGLCGCDEPHDTFPIRHETPNYNGCLSVNAANKCFTITLRHKNAVLGIETVDFYNFALDNYPIYICIKHL